MDKVQGHKKLRILTTYSLLGRYLPCTNTMQMTGNKRKYNHIAVDRCLRGLWQCARMCISPEKGTYLRLFKCRMQGRNCSYQETVRCANMKLPMSTHESCWARGESMHAREPITKCKNEPTATIEKVNYLCSANEIGEK